MEEKFGDLEVLKEHLSCTNPIANRVIGRFGQHYWVFSRVDIQQLEYVSPDSLHIIPILHNSVLHRIT